MNAHLDLINLIWPARCLCCEHPTRRAGFCPECRALITPREGPRCRTCDVAYADRGGPERRCGACLARPPAFERVYALFDYAGPIGEALRAGKYGRDPSAIAWVAREAARHLPAALREDPPGAILPTPLHPRRLAQRGFSTPRILASTVSRALGRPTRERALRRLRDTPPQAGLKGRARRRNVRGAFGVKGQPPADALIVDDVFTTGETARAMAAALRRAGCGRVRILAAAAVELD